MRYDPTHAPDPASWLGTAESDRLKAVLQHHNLIRPSQHRTSRRSLIASRSWPMAHPQALFHHFQQPLQGRITIPESWGEYHARALAELVA